MFQDVISKWYVFPHYYCFQTIHSNERDTHTQTWIFKPRYSSEPFRWKKNLFLSISNWCNFRSAGYYKRKHELSNMLNNIEYYTYIIGLQNLPSEWQQSSCKSADSPEKKNRILLITSQPNQRNIKTLRDQASQPAGYQHISLLHVSIMLYFET
jgi:hypothetical protein